MTPTTNPYSNDQPSGFQRLQQQALRPLPCPRCGSDWLYEINLRQYQANSYSAMPGGDIQYLTETYHTVRMCPCGHVIAPNIGGSRGGRAASQDLASLRTALDAVAAYEKSLEPEPKAAEAEDKDPSTASLLEQFVELKKDLMAQVTSLQEVVDGLAQRGEEVRVMVEDLQTRPEAKKGR